MLLPEKFFPTDVADGKKFRQMPKIRHSKAKRWMLCTSVFFPYLKELPERQQEALYLVARDVENTFRKQGFMEGFMAAVDWICGEENVNE